MSVTGNDTISHAEEKRSALTNAERQARYRARRKEQGLKRLYIDPQAAAKSKQKAEWEAEIQEEKAKAARKAARESEQRKHYRRGWAAGVVQVCCGMVRRGRSDIAANILAENYLDRQTCVENAVGSMELAQLDKGGVFDAQGKPVKVMFSV